MGCICLLLLSIGFMQLGKLKFEIAVIVACFSVAGLSACIGRSEVNSDSGYLTDIALITKNSDCFIGKSVSVRNDVLQIIGTKGLILDEDRLFDGQPILVINTSEVFLESSSDRTPEVLIEGKVERFNLNTIAQKYSLDLEFDLYSQYEGKPAIIATSLILSPDPEDLTANPQMYYNRPLAIKGEVDDVMANGIFELDEEKAFGGKDLLVIQSGQKTQLEKEQTVIVYGLLHQFVADELEKNYDLNWDSSLRSEIEAEYNQKPVFVTRKIQFL